MFLNDTRYTAVVVPLAAAAQGKSESRFRKIYNDLESE